MPDQPTPGELSRRFDDLARRIDRLAESVAKLPTADLIAIQLGRVGDRVSQLERGLDAERAARESSSREVMAAIQRITDALDQERKARSDAIDQEQKDRQAAIEFEKARVGTWFRWLAGGVVAALGTTVAQVFGIGHGTP